MDNQENDFGSVSITGRLRSSITVNYAADSRHYAVFELAPPDDLNGGKAIKCIAWNTRAELLEHFASRGDLITVSGTITAEYFITDTGGYFKECNIIEAASIDFPQEEKQSA